MFSSLKIYKISALFKISDIKNKKTPDIRHDDGPLAGKNASKLGILPEGTTPPKASPEVCAPAPAKKYLAFIKPLPIDHEVPLYSSVHYR